METINNVAAAAAKAVWGGNESNREPVSGVKGDTARGEPYDAGNADPATQHNIEDRAANKTTAESSIAAGTNTNTTSINAGATSSGTGVSEGTTESLSAGSLANPTSTTSDTTAGQNDTRSPSDPATSASKAQDVDTETPGPTSEGDNLTGPGPRPLETVAKEHGGDAGNDKPTETTTEEKTPSKPSDESSAKHGTGEEYVKSSGFQADGGDFDATKPGAGREADRLLEEKGIHPGGEGGSGDHSHGHDKSKPSLGERIKAKLHKH